MNTKTLKLGIAFIVLVGLAFAYKPLTELKNNFGKPHNFLADIKLSDVSKIEISKEGESIVLENQGEKWKINGTKEFFADPTIVTSFKTKFDEAKKADLEVISENSDKKADFNTSEELGAQVKLWSGEKLLVDFIVGKPGSDFVSSYISKVNDNQTYSLKTNLTGTLGNLDWYDKNIFKTDKELISKIRFQYPKSEFTVEKIENEWTGTAPYRFSVNEENLTNILDTMSNLRAVEVPEQTFEGTGLEKHTIIVEASGEGFNNILMIGGEDDDGQFYAKRGDSDNIYLVAKSVSNDLSTSINELK